MFTPCADQFVYSSHEEEDGMTFMGMPYISVLILVFLCSSSKSDDNLTHGKPLSPGDTLVSRGGDFALGFFSPASSNTSLYLGIWYHNIPDRTVVWTANRDSPMAATSSPMLAITNSSDLVLSDSEGRTHWVVKMNNITSSGVAAVLRLRDTGNLVLRFPNSSIIWQSFEHPTDTILPGMRFSLSEKSRVVGRLVAWKDPNDPSSGDFSLSLDPNSNLQLFIWYGTRPYYRISILNDVSVSGDIYQKIISYETIGGTGNGFYYTYTISNSSLYVRLLIDYMGVLRTLSWNNRSTWTTISERPASSYDYYASCGPFGYVDYIGNEPTCHCIDGFDPTSLNFSSGCRRTKALECGKQSHFVTLPRMKVPDKFLRILNRSFEECMAECNNNCSSMAYAYSNSSINSIMADQSRCLIWTGDLVDSGKHNNNGEKLYLRLACSPVEKNRRLVKIVLPTIACVLILTCILLVRICKCRASNRRKKEIQKRLMLGCLGSSNQFLGENPDFPFVSFEDIVTTTDNFSNSKQIRRGGFGKVYKGILEGFNEVAIKRLSKDSGQGILEFKNEIVLISKLQHRNLVRLLGCCMHGDERLLIYEYLPNKSLDAFLFDASKQYVLDWPTRLKIIKGVSRGLLYLHQDSRLTVIHRDLKASNILLDSEMTPKISDFGMARIFGGNQHQANTTRVVGTYGYMPPEYVIGGAFSMKSDTYSFGVLLLEIVSGLKISSPQLLVNFVSLTTYAWRLWQDGRATKLVHSSVIESCPLHEVLRCIHVGLLCAQDRPDDRPLMSSVTFMLENEGVLLPAPKQPAYSALQICEIEESRENMEDSLNGASITTIDGR